MNTLGLNTAKFTLKINGFSEDVRVTGFHGEEGISMLYAFTIDVAVPDDGLDLDKIIEKSANLYLHESDGSTARNINGIIVSIEQCESKSRFTTYRAHFVPRHWILTGRQDCRIFQGKTAPDIIKEVLEKAEISADQYALQLKETYEAREYCVQYRESDFDFVKRLMEEEGIFFYFQHSETSHKLIFADDTSAYKPIDGEATVVFRSGDGMVPAEDAISSFRISVSARSAAVTLRDYNFKKPNLNLETRQAQGGPYIFNIYDFHGNYDLPELGNKRAKIRLQTLQRVKRVGAGDSTCMRLVPGFAFMLADHARFNGDYVLTKVMHEGAQPQSLEELGGGETHYRNSFMTLPKDIVYRGPAVGAEETRKAKMQGVQTAIVAGPAGEEIYTDEHGRIKVQFHWDRHGKGNDKSSCWMRVSQLWAGAGWGAMFLPRVGHEVLVDFIEGDPDRPVVVGRVYHGTNRPPYALPGDKTKSTIRSNTSPDRSTHNELLLEDKQGKTKVVLSNAYGHKIIEDEETQALTLQTRDNNVVMLDDKEKLISISTTDGHKCVLDDANKKIGITSKDGQTIELVDNDENTLTLKTQSGNEFHLSDKDEEIGLVTPGGHTLVVSDKKKTVSMTTADAHTITMSDKDKVIKIEDNSGNMVLKFDIGGGSIEFSNANGDIKIGAPVGKVAIEAMDIELKAKNELKMKGELNVNCEAGVNASFKGTMMTTEASGIMTVKGALVQIN